MQQQQQPSHMTEWMDGDRQQHNPMYFTNGQCETQWLSRFSKECARCTRAHDTRTRSVVACPLPIGFYKSPLSDPFICKLDESAPSSWAGLCPRSDQTNNCFRLRFPLLSTGRCEQDTRVHFNQQSHSYSYSRSPNRNRFWFRCGKTVNCVRLSLIFFVLLGTLLFWPTVCQSTEWPMAWFWPGAGERVNFVFCVNNANDGRQTICQIFARTEFSFQAIDCAAWMESSGERARVRERDKEIVF